MTNHHSHNNVVARMAYMNYLSARNIPKEIQQALLYLWLRHPSKEPVQVTLNTATNKYHVKWGNI